MATKTVSVLVHVLLLAACCGNSYSYGINIDEFATSSYDVHIARKPISGDQEYDINNAMVLSSKVGQQYRCLLPANVAPTSQNETGSDTTVLSAVELLRPMESAPCLLKTKDWWTYEFCYGKEIRQFHLHNGQIMGEIISLGVYESDFNWTLAEQEKAKKSRLSRYHLQHYGNGTKCDLTGTPRKAEVRFYCGEGDADRLTAIAESQSCAYTLHVTTAKICSSVYLRPHNRPHPQSVLCEPIVPEEDYQEFIQLEAEEKERKSKLAETMTENTLASPDGNAETGSLVSFEQMLKETVQKQLGFDLGDFEMHFLDNGHHVEQLMQGTLKEPAATSSSGKKDETSTTAASSGIGNEGNQEEHITPGMHTSGVQKEGQQQHLDQESHAASSKNQYSPIKDDEEPLLKETDEMKKIREEIDAMSVDIDHVSKYKENIRHAVSSKFSDILEEAEQEMRNDGVDNAELDRTAAFKHMASSLSKLLDSIGLKDEPEGQMKTDVSEDKSAEDYRSQALEQPVTPPGDVQQTTPPQSLQTEQAIEASASTANKVLIQRIRLEPRIEIKMVDVSDTDTNALGEDFRETEDKSTDPVVTGTRVRTVVAVLQPSGRDARKEEARYHEMEDNYNQVWGRRKKVEL